MPREALVHVLPCLPTGPGVYRMQNAKGDDLYIGKAKNIAKRVGSYTQIHRLPYRLQRMVHLVHHVAVITTANELEALLLEAQLIKQHQPPYNVVLKHNSPLLYLALSCHPFPRLMAKRSHDTSPSLWSMGPFLSRAPLRTVMDMIQHSFRLRPCSDAVFAQRQRPCLQYFIHRCSAPCVGKISTTDYGLCVDNARHWLEADLSQLKKTIENSMKECAKKYDFAQAKRWRDQYLALDHMTPGLFKGNIGKGDIIGWGYASGHGCIQVISCRDGASYVCDTWFHPASSPQEGPELLAAFLQQFYTRIPPPARVMLPFEPARTHDIRLLIKHHHQRMTHLVYPKRGLLAQWVQQANQQAADALHVHLAQTKAKTSIMDQVASALTLPTPPHRVEMYDNSHHQGTCAIGAMVVKIDNEWARNEYQTWNFPPCQDDYAMMRAVMQARFASTQASPPPDPDLIIIDGGKGQLSAVSHELEALGKSHIPHISIAKSHPCDTIILSHGDTLQWPPHHPVLRWIQATRDEAHRFAISTHRRRHRHRMTHSVLDSIPGMGPKRLQALYEAFGTIDMMKKASLHQLRAIVPPTVAARLFDWLHAPSEADSADH